VYGELGASRGLGSVHPVHGELVPDIVSCNTVVKACGNAQQTDRAFEVRKGTAQQCCNPIIDACVTPAQGLRNVRSRTLTDRKASSTSEASTSVQQTPMHNIVPACRRGIRHL
jgi:pentatricopeptide repeat protein